MVKILIADKSTTVRQAIVEALGHLDTVAVQSAVPDLHTAVRSICRQAPDLVITGTELADASGLELIEAARQLVPSSQFVVVGRPPTVDTWCDNHPVAAVRFVEAEPSFHQLREVVASLATSVQDDDADDELRLLGRIAAGIAHDLNNYLCATTAVLALQETAPTDAELRVRARASIDQARRLAASLVRYVRGESPIFELVDLGMLTHRTLAVVAHLIPPAISVHADVAAQLPAVRGVASELEQLVLNLVVNAVDAMPVGGELTVRVQPTRDGAVFIEVSDTGVGISSDVMVTSDGRTASTKPGRRVGLGLGIVRRVIAHHGGSIRFAPRIERTGTVVWVLLPAEPLLWPKHSS